MKKKRLVYIDVMRVFAMLLVILAHSCAAVIAIHHNGQNYRTANSLVVVTEIAVPLFFMISGSVILNSENTYSLKYLFRHRLPRILIPFFVWSVISAFANSAINPKDKIDVADTLLKMFHQPVLVAYWFIYPLITLYLLSPLLKAMVDHVDNGILTYGLFLWFIFVMILPVVTKSVPRSLGIYFDSYPQSKVIVSQSIGYFLLGYRLTLGKHRRINPLINGIVIIGLLELNIWISFTGKLYNLRYLNIISATILPLVTILIYLALRSLEPHYPRWFRAIVEFIAPLSYGVYLIHGILIFYFQTLFKYSQYWTVFGLTTISALFVMAILHSVPFIRRIFT